MPGVPPVSIRTGPLGYRYCLSLPGIVLLFLLLHLYGGSFSATAHSGSFEIHKACLQLPSFLCHCEPRKGRDNP